MTIQDDLRLLIKAARDKEASDLVPHVDDVPPRESSRWTAKDNLAHLTAWRNLAAAELDAVRTGGPAPSAVEQVELNATIYDAARGKTAGAILGEAVCSWDVLTAAIEACSEEDLLKPRLRRPEQAAWQMIPGNTYFHIAQHLDYWHTERGEDQAAEDAATWAHDLAVDVFPSDLSRGFADYNLGCFYATRGRFQEAMRYLRSGFELNPVLLNWAKQDSDLDPIRSEPELARLLEGQG